MPELLPSGRFWRLDDEGFIVNDASVRKVASRHARLLSEVVALYKRHLASPPVGIYLRGTVARGMDTPGLSDLDDFALVADDRERLDIPSKEIERLERDYPEISGFGLGTDPTDELGGGARFSELALLMVTQTMCLAGEDIIPSLPRYRPGVLVANNDIAQVRGDVEEALEQLEKSDPDTTYWCRRVCKNLVRCGFSLTMLDRPGFTRDLYPCHTAFSEKYPGKSEQMRRTVGLALSPTDDPDGLASHLQEFGGWMIEEASSWLSTHNPSGKMELPLTDFPNEVKFSRA